MNMIDNIVQNLVSKAEHDIPLRNALRTSKNGNSITMGDWTMIVTDTITIVDKHNYILFEDINLFNIAKCIIEKLNDNISPSSLQIKELITKDASYGRLLNDVKDY